jgi:GPI mannosyltransferase 3
LALAGFLLGLGVVLRFHYALPAAIIAWGSTWGFWRTRILPIIAGGAVALVCGGLVDLATGMMPFEWVSNNIHQNIGLNRAAEFGVADPFAYLGEWTRYWQGARPLLLLCLLPGIRHQRLLFWTAIATLALHSMIGHKEYRFIFLTTSIFLIIAAIGTVEIITWMAARVPATLARVLPVALPVAWAGLSIALAASGSMRGKWSQYGSTMNLFAQAGKLPSTCGVAVEFTDFWSTGAYSILHRDVPIYLEGALDPAVMSKGLPLQAAPAYNSLIAPDTLASRLPAGYRAVRCLPAGMERDLDAYQLGAKSVCLFHRPGVCHASGFSQHRVDEVLKRLNR